MNDMLYSILTIAVGIFVALVLPKFFKYGTKKKRSKIQFYINIAGIAILIIGVLSLMSSINALMQS